LLHDCCTHFAEINKSVQIYNLYDEDEGKW